MAKFVLLIYEDESQLMRQDDPRWQALWDAYVELDNAARAAGVLIDSQPFMASAQAETVVVRDGRTIAREGPFHDSAHQLTGYYFIQCEDLPAAREWAARIPAATSGGVVEIRQVLELP